MRLGKTAVLYFVSQVVISAAGFVATFAIARFLGADGVGIYALGVALVTWVKIPSVGVFTALSKRISEGVDQDQYFSSGVIMNVLLVTALSSIILLFKGHVNAYIGLPVAELVVAVLVADVMFLTVGFSLQGQKKVAAFGWVKAMERTARTLIQVLLLVLGYQVAELFLGHAVALLFGAVIAIYHLKPRLRRPHRHHFESLLAYARYGWSGGLKGKTFGWMDTLVLGLFVSASLIGVYEVAWTLASFLTLLSISISSTLFPEFSELSAGENYDKVHHYLSEGLTYTGILSIPGFFGAMAIGDSVLRIYGPEFRAGSLVLLVLIAARGFNGFAEQLISTIRAVNRPKVAMRIDLLFVGLNVGLNIVLIYLFGWYGAAVATLISGVAGLVAGYYSLSKVIGRPRIPVSEVSKQVAAGALMYAVVSGLSFYLPKDHLSTLFMVLVGGVTYFAVLLTVSKEVRDKSMSLLPKEI